MTNPTCPDCMGEGLIYEHSGCQELEGRPCRCTRAAQSGQAITTVRWCDPCRKGVSDTCASAGGTCMLGLSRAAAAAPQPAAQRKPLTDEQLWSNDEIMSLNADFGWHLDTIRMFCRAIERAHGIGEQPAAQGEPQGAAQADEMATLREGWRKVAEHRPAVAEPQSAAHPSKHTDAEHAAWLADKIVSGGDYAKEAADMLRRWPAQGAARAVATLPYDVKVGGATFREGVALDTFIEAARRWHREAFPDVYNLTPEQKAHNLAVLQGRATPTPAEDGRHAAQKGGAA